MRDVEVQPRRPEEIRVECIGDSFTFGHGVRMREAYPKVLEELLQSRLRRPVSVLNAGVPGYGTDQAYRAFLRSARVLAPDLVLAGIHCSDVEDNIDRPLYDIRDGHLVPLDARRTWLFLQGRLIQAAPRLLRSSYAFDLALEALRGRDLFGERPTGVDLTAWSREKIRLEVEDLARRGRDARFTVAVVLMPCLGGSGPASTTWPGNYGPLPAMLAATGVPVLAATAQLTSRRERLESLFFPKDGHMNVLGNAVLGEMIADFVTQNVLPSS
jgi:lysophospholipase L1-like esterase